MSMRTNQRGMEGGNDYNPDDAYDFSDDGVIATYIQESGWDPVNDHTDALQANDHPAFQVTAEEFAAREPLTHLTSEQRTMRWQVHHAVFEAADHPDRHEAAEQIAEEVFHPLRARIDRGAYEEFQDPERMPNSDLAHHIVATEQSNFAQALADAEEYAPESMEEAYQSATDAIIASEAPATRANVNWEEFTAEHSIDAKHYEFLADSYTTAAFNAADLEIQAMEEDDPETARALRAYSHHLQSDMKIQIINDLEAGSVEFSAPNRDFGQHQLEAVLNGTEPFLDMPESHGLDLSASHNVASIDQAEQLVAAWSNALENGVLQTRDQHTASFITSQIDEAADAIEQLRQHEHIEGIEHHKQAMYQTINESLDHLAIIARQGHES